MLNKEQQELVGKMIASATDERELEFLSLIKELDEEGREELLKTLKGMVAKQ